MPSAPPRHVVVFGFLLLTMALASSGGLNADDTPAGGVTLTRPWPKARFERPLFLCEMPAQPAGQRLLVVCEQCGKIWGLPPEGGTPTLLWDASAKVLAPGNPIKGKDEEGLLGLAFHPRFKDNRLAYVHYSAGTGAEGGGYEKRHNVLASIRVKADGTFDHASESVIFEQEQPEWNHNGGMVVFGPDGYLYLGLGDGGGGGDQHGAAGNGQNLATCLGKILRIDVDHADPARGTKYAIPKDNPFATPEWTAKGARPEIYALGLRNPWRFSFDAKDGTLWCGDVGQNLWEEIDIIAKGGNYGWRIREAAHDFHGKETAATERVINPIHEYPHSDGKSVTGGHVYRGEKMRRWQGRYFFGDYVSGQIWALEFDGREVRRNDPVAKVPGLSSFGVDAEGNLYACSFIDHTVYRLDQAK